MTELLYYNYISLQIYTNVKLLTTTTFTIRSISK